MQCRGVAIVKEEGKYVGRQRAADYAEIKGWGAGNGETIAQTAEHFGVSAATVKRACAECPRANRRYRYSSISTTPPSDSMRDRTSSGTSGTRSPV